MMAYPGLVFVAVGVGFAAFLYYMLSDNRGHRDSYRYAHSSYEYTNRSRPTYGDQRTCTICFGDFLNVLDVQLLNCGHEFHKACLALWQRQQQTCPNCRHPIS